MKIDLSGNVALVTGGSRGIGWEISRSLAETGATVIINYHKSEDKAGSLKAEIEGRGGIAETFRADIGAPQEVEALFQFIRERYGRLDILINNAGIIKDTLLLGMELPEWNRVIGLNLTGAFLCTKYAAELMLTRHAGRIVNISSVSANKGGRGQTNYAASKGGLVSFTRACAVELAGKGIRVNAVLPGVVATDMTSRVMKRAGDVILKGIPLGRLGSPSDVANLVVFLCSDLAEYITGQAITVDGGFSIS